MKKATGFIMLLLLMCASVTGLAFAAENVQINQGAIAVVTEVVDVATIKVTMEGADNTALIRLIGVEANKNDGALAYLNGLVGKNVALSFDPAIQTPILENNYNYNVMYVTRTDTNALVNSYLTENLGVASKTAHKDASMFKTAVYVPSASTNLATATPIGGSAVTTVTTTTIPAVTSSSSTATTTTGISSSASTFSWNDNNWYIRNGRYYYYMNGLFYIYNTDGTYSPTNERLTSAEKTTAPPVNYGNSYPQYYFDPYYYNSWYYYGDSYYNNNYYDRYDSRYYSDNRTYYDSNGRSYYYDSYGNKVYYSSSSNYYYNDYYYNDYYYNRDYRYYDNCYPYNLYSSTGMYNHYYRNNDRYDRPKR